MQGEPAALDRFDRLIRADVLGDEIIRVKVWDAEGKIVYSDEPRLIGQQLRARRGRAAGARQRRPDAELSDLTEPENQYERDQGQLLEAYARIRGPGDQPLLVRDLYRSTATSPRAGVTSGSRSCRR